MAIFKIGKRYQKINDVKWDRPMQTNEQTLSIEKGRNINLLVTTMSFCQNLQKS